MPKGPALILPFRWRAAMLPTRKKREREKYEILLAQQYLSCLKRIKTLLPTSGLLEHRRKRGSPSMQSCLICTIQAVPSQLVLLLNNAWIVFSVITFCSLTEIYNVTSSALKGSPHSLNQFRERKKNYAAHNLTHKHKADPTMRTTQTKQKAHNHRKNTE